MRVTINGDLQEVPDTCATIRDLLAHLQLDQKIVVVEHNRRILQKEDHASSELKEGDQIELVHFVGGG